MQFDLAGFLTTGAAVLVMLGILSSLIIVHEFGHWSVARFFGFQTPIFGFGLPFGPTWSLGKKWDTEFKIHACLVGGYVAIPELGDESNATQEHFGVQLKPFKKFPVWQRMLVAFAGVNNNIIFAWLVMFIMLMTLGVPKQDVVVHNLPAANPIAKEAGVQAGDRIVSIDDKKMAGVDDVIQYLGKHKKETVVLHIFRPDQVAPPATKSTDGKEKDSTAISTATDTAAGTATSTATATTTATASDTSTSAAKQAEEEDEDVTKDATPLPGKNIDITVTTNADGKVGMALVGKGKMTYQKLDGSPLDIAVMSVQKLWSLTTSMLDAMGMMIQGIFSGGGGGQTATGQPAPKMGIDDLHGVLAVVKIGADIAQQDWTQLFMFTIMISMDLAIINLVPWPALDGGHLAFMLVELLTGKPMNERAQNALVKWGFVSLLVLMAVIMVNDVRALFTGQLDVKVKSGKKHTQEKKDQDQKAPDNPQKEPTVDNNALPEGPAGTPTPAPAHP